VDHLDHRVNQNHLLVSHVDALRIWRYTYLMRVRRITWKDSQNLLANDCLREAYLGTT
jgi:hypothetical protein